MFKHIEARIFDEKGAACNLFLKIVVRNNGKQGNPKIHGAFEQERNEYFKLLWMRAANKNIINQTMNNKRSNYFNTFSNTFSYKYKHS